MSSSSPDQPRAGPCLLVLLLFPILYEMPVIWKFGAFTEGDAELAQKIAFVTHWRDGLSLAWTQLVDCGTAFFGSTNASLSPWDPLILVLNPVWVSNLAFISYLIAAGVGFFLWRRRACAASTMGALFGALVYQGSSYALINTSIGHETLMQQYAWFPWAMWLVDRLTEGRRQRFWLMFPWVIFGMTLSTYPYLTWILGSIMALRLIWKLREQQTPWPRVAGELFRLGAAAVLGVGFFSFFLVPAAHFANQTIVPGQPGFNIPGYKYHITLPLTHLLTLLNPFFFGESRHQTFWSQFLAHTRIGGFHEYVIYCGLAPIAITWTARRYLWENREARFWLGLLALYTLVCLGKYGGLYPLLSKLPVLRYFRGPARYTVIWPIAMAVLACLAFQRPRPVAELAREYGRATLKLALGALLLAFIAWAGTSILLDWMPWEKWVPVAAWPRVNEIVQSMILPGFATNLTVMIILTAALGAIWWSGRAVRIPMIHLMVGLLAFDLAFTAWMACWRPSYNYLNYQKNNPLGNYLAAHVRANHERVMDVNYALPPLRCLLDRFEQIDGYKPLHLPWYQEFINQLNGQPIQNYDTYDYHAYNFSSPLLSYLRVRYIVAAKKLTVNAPVVAEFGSTRVYETQQVLPLFFTSSVGQEIDEKKARLEFIERTLSEGKLPMVVEEDEDGCLQGNPLPVSACPPAAFRVKRGVDYDVVVPDTNRTALLGSSVAWYDEWQAFDQNGRSLKVLRVNHAFLGVKVPPHSREVRLRFAANAHRQGGWLSATCLGLYALGCLWKRDHGRG